MKRCSVATEDFHQLVALTGCVGGRPMDIREHKE
jgi:hypothetical protein